MKKKYFLLPVLVVALTAILFKKHKIGPCSPELEILLNSKV